MSDPLSETTPRLALPYLMPAQAQKHGLAELTEHRENTGSKAKAAEDIPDAVRNLVGEKSRNDARLHQLVSRCYG